MKRAVPLAVVAFTLLTGCNRNPAIASQRHIRAGQKYFDEHKYDDASLEFRRALQANPKSTDAEYRLGLSYMQLRRWREAYGAFTQTIGLDPQNANAHIQIAELDLAASQSQDGQQQIHLQDAQQQISETLKLDKNNVEGLILSGQLSLQENKYADAQQDFIRANELAPHDINALNFLATTYGFLKNYDQAEKTYQQAIAIDPSSVASYLYLANLYGREGKTDQISPTLESAIQKNPKALPPYFALADFDVQLGKSASVGSLFSELRANTGNSPESSLAIAQFYVAHGQAEKGQTILADLVSKDSGNIQARKELIEVDLDLQQTAEAEKLNQQLLKDHPDDVDARLYRGRLLLAENKTSDALILLQQLVHDAPDMAAAHYVLAVAYGQQGEPDREIDSLKASLTRDPNLILAYLALGQLYIQRGDGKLALSYAEEALSRNPHLLVALLTRANAELLLHEPQAAEQELIALASADPKNPAVQERLGYTQLVQQKFNDASSHFEEALKLQPDFVPAMQDLYTLYQSQNKQNLAIARIQQQIQRAPQQPYFYELLGNVYQSQGNLGPAEDAYKSALAHGTDTNNADVYARLAQIYDAQHNYSQAISDAESSLSENPNLLISYILEGNAYENTGQLDQAKQAYRNALARNPDFAVALNNLAWLECEHGGNLDEALSLAEHARQVDPHNPEISDTLAWIEYRKGLYRSALPLATEAAADSPNDGSVQYHLGMTLLKVGDTARARQTLHRALQLQLDPSDAEAARSALGPS
jgi:tetratricopeptide (TPR) repeat protein